MFYKAVKHFWNSFKLRTQYIEFRLVVIRIIIYIFFLIEYS